MGLPWSFIAPTANTVGKEAGTCKHSQPSLPAAATIKTLLSLHSCTALSNQPSASPLSVSCPALTLIICAPALTACSMARAKSS